MKNEEIRAFRFLVGIAVACMEEFRPKEETVTAQSACDYVAGVLETVFDGTGIRFSVQPLAYPSRSKFPVVIDLDGMDQLLFWYQPYAEAASISRELEGVLHDAVARFGKVPVRGVPA